MGIGTYSLVAMRVAPTKLSRAQSLDRNGAVKATALLAVMMISQLSSILLIDMRQFSTELVSLILSGAALDYLEPPCLASSADIPMDRFA